MATSVAWSSVSRVSSKSEHGKSSWSTSWCFTMWWLWWMRPSSPSNGTSTFIMWPFWTMASSRSRWMASFYYDECAGHELSLPSPCSIWPSGCPWSSYYDFPIWYCEYTSKTRSSSKSYTLDTFAELWNGHQPVGRKTWRSYQQEI